MCSSDLLFLYFTGSDWCPMCFTFDKNILEQEKFTQATKDKFIFVMVDFPVKKDLPAELEKRNHAQRTFKCSQGGAFKC